MSILQRNPRADLFRQWGESAWTHPREFQESVVEKGKYDACDHPDTCGGPWGQPICVPCIEYAKAHVW